MVGKFRFFRVEPSVIAGVYDVINTGNPAEMKASASAKVSFPRKSSAGLPLSSKEIYLNNNNIGAEGAKHVAEALKVNTSLNGLIGGNNIRDKGAKHVADALKVIFVGKNLVAS